MADENTCKGDGCGKPLVVMEWNSDVDMLICDNIQCKLYHTPVGHIPKGIRIKVARRSKTKIPDWLGEAPHGTETTKFTSRVQRLRDFLYTEK